MALDQVDQQQLPAISPRVAVFLSVSFTVFYVLPFYLSSATRPSPTLDRDAPSVIRARVRTVTVTCLLSTIVTAGLILQSSPGDRFDYHVVFHLLGHTPGLSPASFLGPFLLNALLFLGPLFEKFVTSPKTLSQLTTEIIPGLSRLFTSVIPFRNFVAGPVTEEILFRSVIIPLHLLCGYSPHSVVFLTPLYFGIAHVHHLYEFTLTHPSTPLIPAILRSVFQFSYTTIFGWYASFLYLRTASLPAVVVVHSFCNWCGLPRLWGRLSRDEWEDTVVRPPVSTVTLGSGGGGNSPDRDVKDMYGRGEVRSRELGRGATSTYYALLFLGAYGWYKMLWLLTESPASLANFGK